MQADPLVVVDKGPFQPSFGKTLLRRPVDVADFRVVKIEASIPEYHVFWEDDDSRCLHVNQRRHVQGQTPHATEVKDRKVLAFFQRIGVEGQLIRREIDLLDIFKIAHRARSDVRHAGRHDESFTDDAVKHHHDRLSAIAKEKPVHKREQGVIANRNFPECSLVLMVALERLQIRSDHEFGESTPFKRAAAHFCHAIGNRERTLLSGRELPQRIALFAIPASRLLEVQNAVLGIVLRIPFLNLEIAGDGGALANPCRVVGGHDAFRHPEDGLRPSLQRPVADLHRIEMARRVTRLRRQRQHAASLHDAAVIYALAEHILGIYVIRSPFAIGARPYPSVFAHDHEVCGIVAIVPDAFKPVLRTGERPLPVRRGDRPERSRHRLRVVERPGFGRPAHGGQQHADSKRPDPSEEGFHRFVE